MNYKVFQISKSLIPNFNTHKLQEWEIYDKECKRKNINIENKILNNILNIKELNNNINIKYNHVVQYIKYDLINDEYHISKHYDNCKYTIIIYLNKTDNITDKFFIENKSITQNLWNQTDTTYTGLIFWGNALHEGYIYGNGTREILCIFCDSL